MLNSAHLKKKSAHLYFIPKAFQFNLFLAFHRSHSITVLFLNMTLAFIYECVHV